MVAVGTSDGWAVVDAVVVEGSDVVEDEGLVPGGGCVVDVKRPTKVPGEQEW